MAETAAYKDDPDLLQEKQAINADCQQFYSELASVLECFVGGGSFSLDRYQFVKLYC